MVDAELLRHGKVEAFVDADLAHVGGELGVHRKVIVRHLGLVVGAERRVGDPNRKGRKVVQEERVEMIVGDHDDGIGLRRIELVLDRAVVLRRVVQAVLRKLRWIVWGMRNACGGDQAMTKLQDQGGSECAKARSRDKLRSDALA